MKPKLVLFDLDGTLVDSAPDIAAALNAALVDLGQPPHPLPTVTGYVGDGAAKLVERAVGPSTDVDQSLLLERFKAQYAANLCVATRPYPGIVDVLERYAADGTPLAVVTNKPGDLARALLDALALTRYFVDVIGDGDGFPRKPSPEIALAVCGRHGVTPADTLLVGDGLADLGFARAAGCRVAAVAWGYTPREKLVAEHPDWIVETPVALLTLA
ncbi:MAG: haloacid dehalogenase [Myxococcales bacterium]|jgi:phosphoglycolate phosphatase|nr:haloacid dehalogenase [Myxococcales bacterium]